MTECDCLLCQKRKLHPELAAQLDESFRLTIEPTGFYQKLQETYGDEPRGTYAGLRAVYESTEKLFTVDEPAPKATYSYEAIEKSLTPEQKAERAAFQATLDVDMKRALTLQAQAEYITGRRHEWRRDPEQEYGMKLYPADDLAADLRAIEAHRLGTSMAGPREDFQDAMSASLMERCDGREEIEDAEDRSGPRKEESRDAKEHGR